jgi:Ca-activated chloride channel family protein
MQHASLQDEGYWCIVAALPLVLLFFRRGMLFALLLQPFTLGALSWQTPDQQGQKYFEQEAYAEAAAHFQNSDWQASSHYRVGDYAKAAQLFSQNTTADGYYNTGTALAKQGEYDAALEAYTKALELEPDHEDALYNKKLIEEMQKQEEEEKEENEQKQNKDQPKDQQKEQEQEKEQEQKPEEQQEQQQEQEEQESDPQQNIDEKWLQQVPDDPGGLLRRKFLQQYRQKGVRK